jgi:alpha-methylacyl-CoA racemase
MTGPAPAGGPLTGISVLEMAGIGPVPFCASLLADLGADVIRLDRVHGAAGALPDPMLAVDRGRRSVAIDIKLAKGLEVAMRLAAGVDVLLEGFRPGVMERLGMGPEECIAANPGLVYGRMTGWGRDGPLSGVAGHDINYIALTGALHAIGTEGDPVPPLNLIADYGGGAMYLAVGVLAAVIDRRRTGRGQVVDAAMIDGVASLMGVAYRLLAVGFWEDRRAANLLDGGAPFYRTYVTADGGHVAVGAIEPQFYSALLAGLDIDVSALPDQMDRDRWPEIAAVFAERFATRSRSEWEEVFTGTDACVTPVLSLHEAPTHPHNAARHTFTMRNEHPVPAPAPRFSESRTVPSRSASRTGSHTIEVLEQFGYPDAEITSLIGAGVVA